jgi:PAS domain S-box-containing protein
VLPDNNQAQPLDANSQDLRFEAFFNSASIGIIVVNKDGYIVMSNKFANTLFRFEQNSMTGVILETLIPKRYHHRHVKHRDGYTANPQARAMGADMTLMAVRKDGTEFPVEISLGHFESNGDKYTIAFIVDITIRKANEELTKSLEKEKELNDLKTRFVSMASHEFRTPLSTILSSISLLSKYHTTEDQPRRDKHIDRIKSSVKNLTDILNEFLSLGKIEEGKVDVKLDEFNLKEFIKSIINEMSVLLQVNQKIDFKYTGDQMFYSDSNILKHVVVNLLSNAIKFSPEKSVVSIAITIDSYGALMTITDQGIGIPKEDQIHLFERFFRASNVTNIQGTGLGLHIVGRYVHLLQGHITYSSELEKGSQFIIHLPRPIQTEA